MQLEKGYLYHIYNQGNNRRKIFFNKDNYAFFLDKIKTHISPFADIIAYCLMPNHFHLMVLVKEEELPIIESDTMTLSHRITTYRNKTKTINDSIAVLLRSYTRAVNKQENATGSLFKAHTKAECINCFKGITPSFISNKRTLINLISKKQYPQICFDYIHQNPVKANMVKNETDYEFSSAKAYINLADDNIINKKVAMEYIDPKSKGLTTNETLTHNPELELALNFVEKTDRNIFLTGKAGTGKTTFLHKIKTESNKRLVVVAPTGVAAINAKGVTIHSFFQMPFGPIIPGVSKKSKFRFGKIKIDIIRSLDLLIIDEISMVRADLLDGIDQVLRRYKNRNKVFGGVQVLMIGDLQQLSPVVKPHEWSLLSPYYDTPYFFSSSNFKKANAIGIELKHIYRQDNQEFISILNEIRNNKLSSKSAKKLNERYQPNFSPKKEDGYITLTTHNNRANNINNLELDKLTEKNKIYHATINGKFNEYAYPTHEKLVLKVGAQVMFIKNDSDFEKRYYNGKIGVITYLNKDSVGVQCPEDDEVIETSAETWENVSYSLNPDTKEITEDIAGSFSQIPLRLAWAITIHKSQGLTFEKAIIDAEASFAHGQTYVALSRCKSLEGIVLKTKISDKSIINDSRVTNFTNDVEENLPTKSDLDQSQKIYQLNVIEDLFSYAEFLYPTQRLIKIYYENKTSFRGHIIDPLNQIKDNGIVKLMQVATSFKKQLLNLSENSINPEEDKIVQERIHKGINYFIEHSLEHIKKPLDNITFSTDNTALKKDFSKHLDTLEGLIKLKMDCLWGLSKGFSTTKYLEIRAKAVLEDRDIETSKRKNKKQKRADVTDTDHPQLFNALRDLRSKLYEAENIAPYQVFNQKSLYEMCAYFPKTTKELQAINGMGKVRVEKYGKQILAIIHTYVSENEVIPKEVIYEDKPIRKDSKPKSIPTKQHSLNLFKAGKSIEEISKERGFVRGTIFSHLISFIPTGEVKITDLMPMKKYNELKKIMETTKYENTTDLKNKIDEKFTYEEIRLVGSELKK